MEGVQVHGQLTNWAQDVIEELCREDPELKDQIKIRRLNQEGTTTREKEYKNDVNEKYLIKRNKNLTSARRTQMDLSKLKEKSDKSRTVHDESWANRGDTKKAKVVEKLMTLQHYKDCSGRKRGVDEFWEETLVVLPYLLEHGETDEAKFRKMGKKVISDGILKKHLKLINDIAERKVPNSLNDTDVTDLSKDEIKQQFVQVDQSLKLEKIKAEIEDKWAKMEAIYTSAAPDISETYASLMNRPASEDTSWADEEDDEVDEDDSDDEC